jgi:hypothetical protein
MVLEVESENLSMAANPYSLCIVRCLHGYTRDEEEVRLVHC